MPRGQTKAEKQRAALSIFPDAAGVVNENPRLSEADLIRPIGVTGLNQTGGFILEDQTTSGILTGQQWAKTVKQMVDESAVIGGIIYAIETLIRQTEWYLQPADESNEADAHATFFDQCMDDMSQTWSDTLAEIASMLPFGFSYCEQIYKHRGGAVDDPTLRSKYTDNLWAWRKWFNLAQETIPRWGFDDDGGIQGAYQIAPPKYRLEYIPIDKALLFRTTTRKNSPEGRSLLRNAWRSWYFSRNIEQIEAIGIERDLVGLPVAYVPPHVLNTNSKDPRDAAMRQAMTTLVQGLKRGEREGAVFPLEYDQKTGKEVYKLELLSTGGVRQFDTDKIITRYEGRIAMSLLADFILIGHEGRGSYALSQDKTELFRDSLSCFLDMIAGVVNNHAIPRLMRLNGWNVALAPKLSHKGVRRIDLSALTNLVTAFGNVKGGPFFDPLSEPSRFVMGQAGIPTPVDVSTTSEQIPAQGASDTEDKAATASPTAGAQDVEPGESTPAAV